jgi:hypothetical protein
MSDKLTELQKALIDGDIDKEIFLTKDLKPLHVRDLYGNELGDFAAKNYDILDKIPLEHLDKDEVAWLLKRAKDNNRPVKLPEGLGFEKLKNLFENKDNLNNTKLRLDKDGTLKNIGANAAYSHSEDYVLMPNGLYEKPPTSKTISSALHELKHGSQLQGKHTPVDSALIKESLLHNLTGPDLAQANGVGLANAEKVLNKHHVFDSIFEREGLQRLLSGKKLGALLPIAGALGIGAAALGTMDKAQAGDIPGAALTAASAVDPTGIAGAVNTVRDRMQMQPEDAAEATRQDRLSALPIGLDLEESAIQDNERYSALKKKLAP